MTSPEANSTVEHTVAVEESTIEDAGQQPPDLETAEPHIFRGLE
jgi:hypothetical protein